MPWSETTKMRERVRFIADLERGLFSMTELGQRYGISRMTGYKWAGRYEERGLDGLKDRSRAPGSCPHRTAAGVVALLARGKTPPPFLGAEKADHVAGPPSRSPRPSAPRVRSSSAWA